MKKLIGRLLLLAVIVAAAWFGLRWCAGRDWARQHLERRLTRKLDLDITIGSMRLEWPATLVAENLAGRLPGSVSTQPELSVREIRLTPCPRDRLWRGARLVLVRSESGEWQPGLLMGFARALEQENSLDEILNAVARSTRGCLVNLENAAIFVRDEEGDDQPLLGGLNWHSRRVLLGGYRGAALQRASLQTRYGEAVGPEGFRETEWLSLAEHAPIRLADFRDSDSAIPTPAPVVARTAQPLVAAPATPAADDTDEAAPADAADDQAATDALDQDSAKDGEENADLDADADKDENAPVKPGKAAKASKKVDKNAKEVL